MRILFHFVAIFALISNTLIVESLRQEPFQELKHLDVFQKSMKAPRKSGCPLHPNPVYIDEATLLNQLQPAFKKLDIALNAAFAKTGVPGASVVAVYNQTTLYTKGLGVKNVTSTPPQVPDGDTTFRIGSISKVFVDMAAMMLRDQGLIEGLDAQITDYLPEFSMIDLFDDNRGITFKQLGSHLAGTPRESPCEALIGLCNYTTDQMLPLIKNEYYILPQNLQPSYSNMGFALSGRVMERIVNQRFEDYVVENILQPLNMTNTGYDITPQVLEGLAAGYLGGVDSPPVPPYDLGWESPAGQMYSSANDFAKWMKWFFTVNTRTGYDSPHNKNNNNNNKNKANKTNKNNKNTQSNKMAAKPDYIILEPSSVRELFLPVYINDDGNSAFGFPWEMFRDANDYWYLTKSGNVLGWSGLFIIVPSIKLGVAALCNTGQSGSGVLTNTVLAVLEPALQQILQNNQVPPALPPNAKNYVGNYTAMNSTLPATGSVVISQDSNGNSLLFLSMTVQFVGEPIQLVNSFIAYQPNLNVDGLFRLQPRPAQIYCMEYEGGGEQWVQFVLDNQGNVVSFSIPGLWYGFNLFKQ